jgi:hypothetical protein
MMHPSHPSLKVQGSQAPLFIDASGYCSRPGYSLCPEPLEVTNVHGSVKNKLSN